MSTNSTLGGTRKQMYFYDSVLNHEGEWEWAGVMAVTVYVRTSEWDTIEQFNDFCRTLYPNYKQGMRHKVSTTADYANSHDPLLSVCLTVSHEFMNATSWHIYDVPESSRDFDTLSRMSIMEAKLVSLRDAIESVDARLAVETSQSLDEFADIKRQVTILEKKLEEVTEKEDLSGSIQTLNQGSTASSNLKDLPSDFETDSGISEIDPDNEKQIVITFESGSGSLPLHVAAILKTLKTLPRVRCVNDDSEAEWQKIGERLVIQTPPKKWKFGYGEADIRDAKEPQFSDGDLLSLESSDAFSSDWSAVSDDSKV
ncbi:hypothetical protein B0I73DRAFT_128855 [Yarrowia lipolytica]|uniref:YALI0E33385p n=2 Tax=Yarrowia lipolytica TaxID=4952 RepID=Q6C3N4_YARLI|nr:YALI0E33385p [Yarrowia lipolytica CLIB122]AOW06337.1 hypothetical protein YALI1_E39553g [Yarrowia lipolytica]KAB8279880.1 hypothetical protein BKA91DRAFT_142860 [Yarrowia lipolytica]KAE8171210.1 hypothetical protein BKA90DRAFT_139549 [Yarrowia lipolytica]KAJ8057708.1 hypothetical protein LXG23DRAFT_46987 [Yarrowia lipolytica]RDW41293.1 hypothetical protein B0I73DRAFT_128855 [Yarrowia lipolytica]|eukprot:XP_504728.1 YALI0E33385p [Yarrowia lipolytica CLIB122]